MNADQVTDGEANCITLGRVVKFKAEENADDAKQIARLLPAMGSTPSGDNRKDAEEVGEKINALVESLGLKMTLTDKGVSKDQIPVIVSRVTHGVKEGEYYDSLRRLVENLF